MPSFPSLYSEKPPEKWTKPIDKCYFIFIKQSATLKIRKPFSLSVYMFYCDKHILCGICPQMCTFFLTLLRSVQFSGTKFNNPIVPSPPPFPSRRV